MLKLDRDVCFTLRAMATRDVCSTLRAMATVHLTRPGLKLARVQCGYARQRGH